MHLEMTNLLIKSSITLSSVLTLQTAQVNKTTFSNLVNKGDLIRIFNNQLVIAYGGR